MDPLSAGILTAGAGGLLGYFGQQQTNQMNQGMMLQTEDFDRDMSNTAYQRASQDMIAAHLNPMMMFGSGAAASSPSVTAPAMTSPLSSLPGAISHGADTAIAIRGQNSTLDLQGAQTDAASAQADVSDAQAENVQQDTQNKEAERALIQNQQQSTAKDIEAKAYTNQILSETMSAQIKKAKAEGNYAELNQLMGIINSGASSASQFINPLKLLKGK